MVGWLVVFYVPSTARSFRDGVPIYCPLRRTWSSVSTPYPPGTNPGPSRGSPLHYRCARPAPVSVAWHSYMAARMVQVPLLQTGTVAI